MERSLLRRGPALLLVLLTIGFNSQEQPAGAFAAGMVDELGDASGVRREQRVEMLDESAGSRQVPRRKLREDLIDLGAASDPVSQNSTHEIKQDEAERSEGINKLFDAEHAGGMAQDSYQAAEQAYAHSKSRYPKIPTNNTLVVAGTSGTNVKCDVNRDQIVVSGAEDAACLINEPLLVDRVAPVEISFDVEFLSYPEVDPGRHGGIYYGAPGPHTPKANMPTITWTDRAVDKGFHIYGNVDENKAYGLSPGTNPDKHWKLLIKMDGTATFYSGPRRWLQFTPKIKGQFLGFWVGAGTVMRIANYKAVAMPLGGEAYDSHDPPKTNKYFPGIKLEVWSKDRTAEAKFFYSEAGGNGLQPKCVYLEGPSDFRTLHGSIYASEDLNAARSLIIRPENKEVAEGDEHGNGGGAKLYFIKDGQDRFDDDSLYLSGGDFRVPKSHIYARQAIRAGGELQIAAKYGHQYTSLWYSETRDDNTDASVMLKHGDFRTEHGSIKASKMIAREYLEFKSAKASAKSSVKLWYGQSSDDADSSNTLYLKSGGFATGAGSIMAAEDLGGHKLKLGATSGYGEGEATIQYVKSGDDEFGENTVHVLESDFSAKKGSIHAEKDVYVGRSLYLSNSGDKSAHLWYSRRSSHSEWEDTTLYLKSGDLATETGSIGAAEDVIAHRYLRVGSQTKHAKIWHSAMSSGKHQGETLYVKGADFRTEAGNIFSKDLGASRFLSVKALEGFGEGKASLYYSATTSKSHGTESGSLYLKNGDFRVESGSVISANVVAKEAVKIGAKPTFGKGEAKLWYVEIPIGSTSLSRQTLYLEKGDFSTEDGSVRSAQHMSGESVKVGNAGQPGPEVQLWYGKEGGELGSLKPGSPHIVYLRTGDFKTEDGDLVASQDIRVSKGSLSIGAHPGYGKSSGTNTNAELWYSHLGDETTPQKTLHLRDGDFNLAAGSVTGTDVSARRWVKGRKVKAESATCEECHFEQIYLTTAAQKGGAHALRDSLVLLDEGSTRVNVGMALSELTARKQELLKEQSSLKTAISQAEHMLLALESRVQARRML